jgi:hypothetical protein
MARIGRNMWEKHQYCFIVILYCSSSSVIRTKRGRGGTDYPGIRTTGGKVRGVGNKKSLDAEVQTLKGKYCT